MSVRTSRQKPMMPPQRQAPPPTKQLPPQQQRQQPPPQQRQPPPPQQRQPPPQQRQPPPQQQQQPTQKQNKPKMTIGDAIGLITLRLGRVELFIQQLQTDGVDINSMNSMQPNDGLDSGLIENLVSRLNTIEDFSSTNEERMQTIETNLKDTKDLLLKLMLKFENFSDATLGKFEEQQQQIAFNLEQLQQDEPEEQLTSQEEGPEEQSEEQSEALPTPSNESEPVP